MGAFKMLQNYNKRLRITTGGAAHLTVLLNIEHKQTQHHQKTFSKS